MIKEYTIALTGASGNIGSNLIFLLGKDFLPNGNIAINLRLVDIPKQLHRLEGLKMELQDCFFERINKIEIFVDSIEAFQGCNLFIICGAKPRLPGMQRRDLLEKNVLLIKNQAELINQVYETGKIVVVSNPCNTLAYFFKTFAPKVKPEDITFLSTLDQMRACSYIHRSLDLKQSQI